MEQVLVVEDNARKVGTPTAPDTTPRGRSPLPAAAAAPAPTRHAAGERPDAQSVRGRCPECGDDLVSNLYYIPGEGYLIIWACWSSLVEGEAPCRYTKVL